MGSKNPRVDQYIDNAADFARPILEYIRAVVHEAVPDVEETLKWSFPHFMHRGILCSMAAFKAHCAFGFWKGQLVVGEQGTGDATAAMGQFGRIRSLDDLPPRDQLAAYVRKAAALNEAGVKAPAGADGGRRAKAKPPVTPPDDLLAALKAEPRALDVFDGFPPSHKREYVEWITEAKRPETRERRIRQAVEWMAEGKPRNWKYQ